MVMRFAASVSAVAAAVAACGLALTTVSGGDSGEPVVVRAVTEKEKALLYLAEERLIARCMNDAGFEYEELPLATDTDREFPYVVDDVVWARRYGYHRPEAKPPGEAPNVAYYRSLSNKQQREWQTTLVGEGTQISVELPGVGRVSTSSRGCLADARRTLYGDVARWFRARRITDTLSLFVQLAAKNDRRFERAMADWASCMRGRGYDVSNPADVQVNLERETRGLSAADARAKTIQTAVAEATCANSTPLARVITELNGQYERDVDNTFRRERFDLNALELAALPIARKVLADTQSSADIPSDESAAR